MKFQFAHRCARKRAKTQSIRQLFVNGFCWASRNFCGDFLADPFGRCLLIICNQQVVGSNPSAGSTYNYFYLSYFWIMRMPSARGEYLRTWPLLGHLFRVAFPSFLAVQSKFPQLSAALSRCSNGQIIEGKLSNCDSETGRQGCHWTDN
jgi:hypothetical protein